VLQGRSCGSCVLKYLKGRECIIARGGRYVGLNRVEWYSMLLHYLMAVVYTTSLQSVNRIDEGVFGNYFEHSARNNEAT
jgi:hypothetical protein